MSEEQLPKWVIYGLVDPRIEDSLGKVRYIGKTNKNPPDQRLAEHLKHSINNKSHLGAWLRKMVREQVTISLEVGKRLTYKDLIAEVSA